MKYKLRLHKILKILSEKHMLADLNNGEIIGVSNEFLCEKVNIDKYKFREIVSVLYECGEIEDYNCNDLKGIYATEKGISSFAQNKYIYSFLGDIVIFLKGIVQILIPILSLIITLVVVSKNNNQNENFKNRIELLEKQLNSIKK